MSCGRCFRKLCITTDEQEAKGDDRATTISTNDGSTNEYFPTTDSSATRSSSSGNATKCGGNNGNKSTCAYTYIPRIMQTMPTYPPVYITAFNPTNNSNYGGQNNEKKPFKSTTAKTTVTSTAIAPRTIAGAEPA